MSQHRVQITVLVAGKALDATVIRHAPQEFQNELLLARKKFGNALCCCQPRPLPLVIRERGKKLFLAAWPEQSAQHALGCPFYSEPRLEGSAQAAGAVQYEGDVTKIHLHHPIRQPNRTIFAAQAVGDAKASKFSRLHLWGLLHYIWDEAGLNRWHPGWHRDWGFVRHAIRRAAQSTIVDGAPLLQSLYVPPVWVQAKKQEVVEQWNKFVAPLMHSHRRSAEVASGFVIGSVRLMVPHVAGYKLALHHHAIPFMVDERMSKILSQYSRRGWAALKQLDSPVNGDHRPYVIAALRVESTSTGVMHVVEAVLMRVTPRYIPVNSSFEDKVARLLVEQDRQFVRPLHYDNHHAQQPDFILKDSQPYRRPVAMHVYGPALGYIKLHQQIDADRALAEQAGMDFWSWSEALQPQPPPFPPAFSTPHPPKSSKE